MGKMRLPFIDSELLYRLAIYGRFDCIYIFISEKMHYRWFVHLTFAHDNIYYQATIKYHCFLMWLCYDITDLISPNTH
jgi:hypothetical protein